MHKKTCIQVGGLEELDSDKEELSLSPSFASAWHFPLPWWRGAGR